MKISKFVVEIDKAMAEGRLREPFRASDVRAACPGFARITYNCFLPKHAANNPDNNKVHFEKVKYGLYRRLPTPPTTFRTPMGSSVISDQANKKGSIPASYHYLGSGGWVRINDLRVMGSTNMTP